MPGLWQREAEKDSLRRGSSQHERHKSSNGRRRRQLRPRSVSIRLHVRLDLRIVSILSTAECRTDARIDRVELSNRQTRYKTGCRQVRTVP